MGCAHLGPTRRVCMLYRGARGNGINGGEWNWIRKSGEKRGIKLYPPERSSEGGVGVLGVKKSGEDGGALIFWLFSGKFPTGRLLYAILCNNRCPD